MMSFLITHKVFMEIVEGRLVGARQLNSPNFDERPEAEVSLVVIHCISLPAGHYANRCVEAFFLNELDCDLHSDFDDIRAVTVSSHVFIRRSGELIQFVPLEKRAWHAGESRFKGRTNCNDFSIGVELEGIDSDKFTPKQYEVLAEVLRSIRKMWSIKPDCIVGHSDIAPGRKQDPGTGFDWALMHNLVGIER